jgi:hypothetical protein
MFFLNSLTSAWLPQNSGGGFSFSKTWISYKKMDKKNCRSCRRYGLTLSVQSLNLEGERGM